MELSEIPPRLLDLVAPRVCAGCEQPSRAALCQGCVEWLTEQPLPPGCRVAGSAAHAAFLFAGPVRGAVHAAKFGNRPQAMELLAALAAERLGPALLAAPYPDAVVPVALSRRRRRRRGYNQAMLAARPVAELPWGGPVVDGLARIRHTPAQVGRGAASRRDNLVGAFAWQGAALPPRATIWLVDDVLTTGATLEAAGHALQQAGAARIEFVAVGSAP